MDMKKVLEGFTLVAVGGLLLANTTGVLDWGIWWNIFSLWPLLLVAGGIDVVGRSMDNTWLRVLGSVVVIGGLLYGALVMPLGSGPFWWTWDAGGRTVDRNAPATSFDVSEPADSAIDKASLDLEMGAGTLTVKDGSGMFAASGSSPFGDPDYSFSKSGDSADVKFAAGRRGGFNGFSGRSFTDVELSRMVAWDLKVNIGASDTEMDLGDVNVERLTMNMGAADANVTLGDRAQEARVEFKAGASSIKLRIPTGVGVEVHAKSGLASVDVGDEADWDASGQIGDRTWRTKGFDSASKRVFVELNMGAASARIERY